MHDRFETAVRLLLSGEFICSVSHPEVKARGQQFTDRILRDMEVGIDTSPIQALPEPPKKK